MVQLPASAGGGVLAATFDAEGLAAWLLPAAGSLEKLGADSQVGQLCCMQCRFDMCSLPALVYHMPLLLLCNDPQQQPGRPHYATLTLLPPVCPTLRALQPAARRLGGFQVPRDIYSMSLSPCGRWIATGACWGCREAAGSCAWRLAGAGMRHAACCLCGCMHNPCCLAWRHCSSIVPMCSPI